MKQKKFHTPILLGMILLSLGLNWPYIGAGFSGDEIILIKAMEQDPLPYSRWQGAWSGETDDLSWFGNPWWAEPGAIGNFFRPLPSLVIEGSVRLFGPVAWPLHLLSILLHALIGFLLFLLLKRLGTDTLVPLLAGFVYIICEDHSMTVGFISCITDSLAVFFITLSLLGQLSWLRNRRASVLLGTLVAMMAALGSKETAAAAPLALILTAFFFPGGGAGSIEFPGNTQLRDRFKVLFHDTLAWLPAFLLLIIYISLYMGLNLGGMDNLSYINPLSSPVRYLGHMVAHLPALWLATLSPVPVDMIIFEPAILPVLAWGGVLLFPIFLWALWPRRREPVLIWAILLYFLALLPQLGTDAAGRSLYFPFLFASVLIARLVQEIPLIARRIVSSVPGTSIVPRIMGWYLLMVIILGLIFSIITPFSYVKLAPRMARDPGTAAPHMKTSTRHAIILNNRNFFSLLMTPTLLKDRVNRPLDVRILSAHQARATLERTGESSFILKMDRKGWLSNFMARALRRSPELVPGRVYHNSLFDAELVELMADRSDVLAVRFDMHRSFDDPSVLFLFWNGRSFQPLAMTELPINTEIPLNFGRRGIWRTQ